ncbi:defense protein 3-like [Cydia fagiglandana]|uniref:defense protein 3-like n=1 Tax=Cydia fagiglandana TaxID=1458189 RepID=UPI002FEDF2F4
MSVEGSMSENHDRERSKNYELNVSHGDPGNCLKGTAFVNSLTDAGAYKSVGGNVGMEKSGFGGQLGAVHSAKVDQMSAAAKMNVIHTDNHKMDVHAFATKTMPHNQPSFVTHGGGVDYMYKNAVGASASVAHTPMFKHTEQNVGAKFNLHQTPSSAVSLNLGATRSMNPHSSGGFKPNMLFNVQKKF